MAVVFFRALELRQNGAEQLYSESNRPLRWERNFDDPQFGAVIVVAGRKAFC
jgi:hypothetical protein